MVPLEGLHELDEDFGFRLLARSDFWVGRTIVPLREFFHIKFSILIEVECFESALNEISSELTHLSDDDAQELIEVNFSTLVDIHGLEQTLDVLWVNLDAEVAAALLELHEVKGAAAVVVGDLELAAQSNDSVGPARLERLPESLDEDALESGHWRLALDLESWLVRCSISLEWRLALLGWERDLALWLHLLWDRLHDLHGIVVHGAGSIAPRGRHLVSIVVLGVEQRIVLALHSRPLNRARCVSRPELDRLVLTHPPFLVGLERRSVALDIPGIVDHELKVVIVID